MANIRKLEFADNRQALELLQLQLGAYRAEARLTGIHEPPLLAESITTLRQSKETFYGYFEEERLVGAVSFLVEGDVVTICRLMVDERLSRRGIASALLEAIQELVPGTRQWRVIAAARNAPALNLYRKIGFLEQSRQQLAPNLELITLTKVEL
ncbi:GNAT family N-acetyltransferase [Paenibacillus chartarius]|uniref:GNAT family N-acetyltransferase n=1 Tax=Paenibacillus chartarius TaxID=747481 RepID=A0ABV6DLR1_9BACL